MATKVTLTGGTFQDPSGAAVASGKLVLTLSQDARVTDNLQLAPTVVSVALDASGDISGAFSVWGNNDLTPSNTFYTATVLTSDGNIVYGPQKWTINSPGPLNVGSIQPATSTTVSVGNISGMASISAGNISGVRVVDGVIFTTIQAAIDDVPTDGTVYVPDGTSETLSATLTIGKPLTLRLGRNVTLTCGMTIAGAGTGGIDVTSSNVEIIGVRTSLVTQPNAQNIQTMIHLHGNSQIKLFGFKLDGNEDNQTDPTADNSGTAFYTGIRTSSGGSDITIEKMEITRSGDRAIDIRGTDKVWILENYIHGTGLNIAGQTAIAASAGNALSIGIDGAVLSNDVWIINNLFEQWGDSVETSHGFRIHWIGNTLKGRRFFGNTPRDDEVGIGLTGAQDVEVIGNQIYDVAGRHLQATAQTTTPTSIPQNIRVIGNLFKATASGTAGQDSSVNISQGGQNLQLSGIEFSSNRLEGVRAIFGSIDGLTVTGNTFLNTTGSGGSEVGLTLDQAASVGVMRNFLVSNNVFDSNNNTMDTAGINIAAAVTAPGNSLFSGNVITAAVGNPIVFQAGAVLLPIISSSGSSLVLNDLQLDVDFRVAGDSDANLFFLDASVDGVIVAAQQNSLSAVPRWIFKQVDFGDMTAAGTADTFTLWTLPANTMIHDVVGTVVTGWSGGSISAAVASVGTQAGPADGLALDDNFFITGTRYELHDGTAVGGKGSVLFDSTDKFAPHLLLAGGVIELQMDLTGDNHVNATAGQARIYMLVSQPLGNTTIEAN